MISIVAWKVIGSEVSGSVYVPSTVQRTALFVVGTFTFVVNTLFDVPLLYSLSVFVVEVISVVVAPTVFFHLTPDTAEPIKLPVLPAFVKLSVKTCADDPKLGEYALVVLLYV